MTKGNEPINSIPDLNNHPSLWIGLTKREYFAAMRRVESISPEDAKLLMGKDAPEYGTIEYLQYHIEATEKISLIAADALIKALNETK